jgi:hypothetical protein
VADLHLGGVEREAAGLLDLCGDVACEELVGVEAGVSDPANDDAGEILLEPGAEGGLGIRRGGVGEGGE